MDKEQAYATTSEDEYQNNTIGNLTAKREAPIQVKLDELEKALVSLGERTQMYLAATEQVRRISPTAETERGDADKPHHSNLTHRLDRYISIVNTYNYNITSAQEELEL